MEKVELTPELIEKFQKGEGVSMEDLVQAFNPATASSIPESLIDLMPHLTGEQIQELAKAYPNKPTGNTYLVLKDKNFKGNQAFPRSTWENLANLRKIAGEAGQGWVALNFNSRFSQANNKTFIKPSATQDISKAEINTLPGIVSGEQQKVSELGTGEQAATGQAQTLFPQAQQQAEGTQGNQGAENANGQGSEFPEVTVEQIQKDQAGLQGSNDTATTGTGEETTGGEETTSGRTVLTPAQKRAQTIAAKKEAGTGTEETK